ncbi:MAG: tubulin-like doman-containing protein [Candidatus Zixiibacteriota bacterium]
MSYQLRRSVIIGLGGTGLDTVLNIKHKFWQVYGQGRLTTDGFARLPDGLLRGIRFVVFDTADPKPLLTESGARIGLDPSEFIHLSVMDPTILLRQNREIRDWYPEKVPARAIFAGAGQIRALGRLALFANCDRVYRAIQSVFQDVRDFKVTQKEETDFDYPFRDVVVYIVGSMAGGTGGGTFLDMGFLCRRFLGQQDTSVAMLLQPDVFTSLPGSDNVEPNAYGALRELDYYMEAKSPFQTYLFNDERIECRPPFDIINLINNRNLAGDVFQDVEYMTEVIGTSIFAAVGTAGQKQSLIWDNLKHQITAQGYWDGKKPQYSSFGIAELVYDGSRYAQMAALEVAIDVVSKAFLTAHSNELLGEVESFMDTARIREEDADQVIDDLMLVTGLPRFGIPNDISRSAITEAHQRRPQFVDGARATIKQQLLENLELIRISRSKALDDQVGATIRTPGGANRAIQFLTLLLTRLEHGRELMLAEANQYKVQLDAAEANATRLEQAGKKLTTGFLPPSRASLESHLRLYAQASDQIVLLHAQRERRIDATEFFGYFTGVVRQWSESLTQFVKSMSAVQQRLGEQLGKLRMYARRLRPFTLEVQAPSTRLEDIRIRPEEFLRWLEESKPKGLVSLIDSSIEQMQDCVLQFALELPKVTQLRQRSVEDVLLALPEVDRWQYIVKLYHMAVPLWNYEHGFVTGGKRKTVNVLLFGVGNSRATFLTADELKNRLPAEATNYTPDVVDTGDNRRILCVNTHAALPAYAILFVKDRYREPFFDENRPFTYHIHKAWDSEIPDLIPPTETEEDHLIWTLAVSDPFGMIKQVGNFYEVRTEKRGERVRDFWLRLDNGRSQSARKFLQDVEVLNEIRDKIDQVLRNEGNERIREKLLTYRSKLMSSLKGATSDTRDQKEKELRDLDAYTTQLKEI